MTKPSFASIFAAACCVLLLGLSLSGCGGAASSGPAPNPSANGSDLAAQLTPGALAPQVQTDLGRIDPVIEGRAEAYTLPTGWSLGELPGTIAPQGLQRGTQAVDQTRATAKGSSAIDVGLIGPGPHTLTASGQFGSPNYYDYMASGLIDLAAGMDTGTDELHITGNVLASNIADMIYAEFGLVTEEVYQLAVSNGTPSYMFNQSVCFLNALDAGTPFVVPLDYDGVNGTDFASAQTYPGNSYSFDLQLLVDPGQQYRGAAYLSINGGAYVPVGGWSYGTDNWGWRPPEDFSECRLVAQLYSYNPNPVVVGSLTFSDLRLVEGPLGVDSPHPWPNLGKDSRRSSYSAVTGPVTSGQKWPAYQPDSGYFIMSSPVLADDGTLYFVDTNLVNSRLQAVDSATGLSKWAAPLTLPSGYVLTGTPALSNGSGDGPGGSKRIYIGTRNGEFYTIRDDGNAGVITATIAGGGEMQWSSPVVARSGMVFTSNLNGFVFGISAAGAPVWATGPIGFIPGSPTLSPDGALVYVATQSGHVYALSAASGAVLHDSGVLGGPFFCTPAVSGSGLVYVSDYLLGNSTLWELDFDLAVNWSMPQAGSTNMTKHALGTSGVYGTATSANALLAVDPLTQLLKWSFPTLLSNGSSCPTVDVNNNVYFGSGDGFFYAVHDGSTAGNLLWNFDTGAAVSGSPMIGPDNTLYITSQTHLYAFNDSGAQDINIDCTALGDASFAVRTTPGPQDPATDPYATAFLTTNSIYDASALGFGPGDQFYVSFAVDNAAQPSDTVLYPSIPVLGLVTVNAGGLTLPAPVAGADNDLSDYFQVSGGGWTLALLPGAYNRISNDFDSLGFADFSLLTSGGATIGGPWDTNTSASDTQVFASGVQYRPLFSTQAYPLASDRVIYPAEHPTGFIRVSGFPAPTLAEGGSVLGNYYDQAGLVNTLQADAYCRIEADLSLMTVSCRARDEAGPTWFVFNPPMPPGSDPYLALVIARGITFTLRNDILTPAWNSQPLTITPGRTINNLTSVSQTSPIFGTYRLTVLPVRSWDDNAAADPGGSITITAGGWDVDLNFLLQYGVTNAAGLSNLTVELDADYGSAWNDGTPGRTFAVPGSPFTSTGLKNATLSIPSASLPTGVYQFALRVTDNNSGAQYIYVWPGQAGLPLLIDTLGDVGRFPSITLVSGNPAIAYYDNGNGDLTYVRANDASGFSWAAPVRFTDARNFGLNPSLLMVNGNPAIACFNTTDDELLYVRATDATGSAWGAIQVVDTAGSVGEFPSLQIVNGNPAISYYASGSQDLLYVRATDASGSAWGTPVTVDSANASGQYSSLRIVSGNPAISYYRSGGGTDDLMFVRATDASGTAWGAPVTVDTTSNTGLYTSMQVASGNPAISYYNSTNGNLVYIRASSPNGNAWATGRIAVEMTNDIGRWTCLALIGGLPSISYIDATNFDLRYARSTTASGYPAGSMTPVLLDSDGLIGMGTSQVEASGAAGIAYYELTTGSLRYIRY